MPTIPFDVNDARLREAFLRRVLIPTLAALDKDARAGWGKMTAQQMVEHLEWAFALSTGQASAECLIDEAQRERMKAFLYSNRPTPREFMNPVLAAGLPPLRHGGLDAARAVLTAEVAGFLEQWTRTPALVRMHPVFGPIPLDDWARAHYKHSYHHLLQFALIAAAP